MGHPHSTTDSYQFSWLHLTRVECQPDSLTENMPFLFDPVFDWPDSLTAHCCPQTMMLGVSIRG